MIFEDSLQVEAMVPNELSSRALSWGEWCLLQQFRCPLGHPLTRVSGLESCLAQLLVQLLAGAHPDTQWPLKCLGPCTNTDWVSKLLAMLCHSLTYCGHLGEWTKVFFFFFFICLSNKSKTEGEEKGSLLWSLRLTKDGLDQFTGALKVYPGFDP